MARDDESRPLSKVGPAITNTYGPPSVTRPCDELLARLCRVRKSPRGWTASCPGPSHQRGDKSPSLSVAETDDGRVLVHCFSGCTAEEITRALRLELRDLFPPRDDRWPLRPRPRAHPVTVPPSIARELVESNAFAKVWTIGKALAELEHRQQRADVLASWDYLTERVDLPTVIQLASLIRGAALFRYCAPDRCEDADVARAVRRLVEEVETNG